MEKTKTNKLSKTLFRLTYNIILISLLSFFMTNKVVAEEEKINNYTKILDERGEAYYIKFNVNNQTQEFLVQEEGSYRLEVWGGGGESGGSEKSSGAYASGELYLEAGEKLFVRLGVSGQSATTFERNGIFLGAVSGGKTYQGTSSSDSSVIYGGGGSSIGWGWKLNERIIVAGGGGSKGGANSCPGGSGGGEVGFPGKSTDGRIVTGGTQSNGGTGGTQPYSSGVFGYGANGGQGNFNGSYNNRYIAGGAGGSGWYGGGGANSTWSPDKTLCTGGGGGSSYALTSSSFRPSNYHPNEKYFLKNTVLIDGNSTMPTWGSRKGETIVGNSGDGHARITRLFDDARLSVLEHSKGRLSTDFNPDIYEYDLFLQPDESELSIKVEPLQVYSVIDWKNEEVHVISHGDSLLNILVTSGSGNSNIYTINVHRPISTSTKLEDITMNGITLEDFNPSTRSYTLNLPYNTDKEVVFDWIKGHPFQDVVGSKEVTLKNGVPIVFRVYAEDDVFHDNYTIIPNIENSNLLKSLIIDQAYLDFDENIFEYDIDVPLSVSSLNMTAIPYDDDAIVDMDGNGYLKVGSNKVVVTVNEPNLPIQKYILNVNRTTDGNVDQEFGYIYTGDIQYFTAKYTGDYKLEAWGGEGGNRGGTAKGGRGGYSTGIVRLRRGETIAVYVAGAGTKEHKGFNGGGISGTPDVYGGGASDIRVGGYTLFDRILVAGGGGSVGGYYRAGYAGGGLNGLGSTTLVTNLGSGGTQIVAGTRGQFGVGGNGLSSAHSNSAAGGGGWFGGGATNPYTLSKNDLAYGGGGGSGYVLTPTSYKPTGYNVEPHYYLQDAYTLGGNVSIPNKKGGNSIGNEGNGYVRITALRQASSDNFLRSINLDKGAKVSPNFNMDITEYSVHLTKDHTELVVNAVPMDVSSEVTGTGVYDIGSNGETVEISVVAEDGTVRVYTIHVTRELSNNPLPNHIEVTGLIPSLCELSEEYCKFDPVFRPEDNLESGRGVYTIIVPARIDSLEFTPIKSHPYQVITGAGVIQLEIGDQNTITIEVASEDGNNWSSYKFIIDRDMTGNADLEVLGLKNPYRELDYNPDVTEYYLAVPNDIDHTDLIEFDIKTLDPNASAELTGLGALALGNNKLEILVTANNGMKKKYVLYIFREHNGNTFLRHLKVFNNETLLPMAPGYTKTITDYLITVDNDVKEVRIDTDIEAPTTFLSMNNEGLYELKVGTNTINITTTAEDGSSSIYTLTIVRKPSNNAMIKKLYLDESLVYDFDPEKLVQTIKVDSHLIKPYLRVELDHTKAHYRVDTHFLDLQPGDNFVDVRVEAESGEEKTYTINFHRPASTDATLKEISSNLFDLTGKFDPEIKEYELNIPYTEEMVIVNSKPTYTTSRVGGNGRYPLVSGENMINLIVTAEDGSFDVYTLRINMFKNNNAEIKTLSVNKGTLDPDFNSKVMDYQLNVPYDVETLSVEGTFVISSTTTNDFKDYILEVGENIISINTKSESGKTLTYTIRITRDQSDNADLDFLIVHEGALNREFKSNVIEYDVKVPYGTRKLTIEARTSDVNANYHFIGNENLRQGLNKVIVRVSPPSANTRLVNDTYKDYTLNVWVQDVPSESLDLRSLIVNPGTLTPDFYPSRQFYRASVSNEVKNINVIATPGVELETTGNGTYPLEVGENLIVITVKANNGVIKDFQIIVTRNKSSEAGLGNLYVSRRTNKFEFSNKVDSYIINTDSTSLGITAVPLHKSATVEIFGNSNFVTHVRAEVRIVVTAEDGVTQKTYILYVDKKFSNNNNLSFLELSNVKYAPDFSPSVFAYSATVPEYMERVIVNAAPQEPNATAIYNTVETLQVGDNYIDVDVKSESGEIRTYTVVVRREGSFINDLSSLTIDRESVSDFDKNGTIYHKEVEYDVDSVLIDGERVDPKSTVTGLGHKSLKVGVNEINVTVTSENGEAKVYTIYLSRKPINSALIESLSARGYPFENNFDSNRKDYNLSVNYETTSLNLDVLLEDKDATVIIEGNSDFVVGDNVITLEVTSSNRDKFETYTIHVYRQEYANNFLSHLLVSHGTLSPVFKKETTVYHVEVGAEVTGITLSGDVMEASSTHEGLTYHTLDYGLNRLDVYVKAHNGIVRTYHVFVNRKLPQDNYLRSLKVQMGGKNLEFSPGFDPDVNTYTLNEKIPAGTEFLNLLVTSNAPSVVGHNQQAIKVGINALEIVVTSESGEENVYTINYERIPSMDNNLTSITPSSGHMTPFFIFTESNYILDVSTATTMLEFSVNTQDRNATVTGHERAIVPVGESKRIITVKAEDGSTKEYTIRVFKKEDNNTRLKRLKVDGYEFDVSFDPYNYLYQIHVPNRKKELRSYEVTYELEDNNASVTTSQDIQLLTGGVPNLFEVMVTAPDGFTTETYRIQVFRELSDDATISEFKLSSFKLNRTFQKTMFNYDIEFDEYDTVFTKDDIETLITTDEHATPTLSKESIDLVEGYIEPLDIEVKAEDGMTTENYVFNFKYVPSTDNKLSTLSIKDAKLKPSFNSEIFEYDVDVHEFTSSIDISAMVRDPKAHIISIMGNKTLHEYLTVLEVVVQAEDGSEQAYKLNVRRNLSNSVSLEDIILNNKQGAVLNPLFDDFLSSYEAHVSRETDKVGLIVTKGHESQTLTFYDKFVNQISMDSFDLVIGKNKFKLKVESPYGDTRFIDFTIYRSGNESTRLEILEILAPEVDFTFDPDVMEYFIEIPHDYDQLTLNAKAEEYSSTVEILKNKDLKGGNNDVIIKVTSEIGETRNYIIHVFKNSQYDNTLETISVSTGSMESSDPSIFTPHFKKGVTSYSVRLKSTDKQVLVEGVAAEPTTVNASIADKTQIIGETKHGILITLKPGNNVVKLTTENNGHILVYTVNLIREMSNDANLKVLEIYDGTKMIPFNENGGVFSEYHNFYTMEVSEVDNLRIHAEALNANSRVTGDGVVTILNGDNRFTVVVASEDRTRSKAYTIIITKTLPKDNTLRTLNITHGNEEPTAFLLSENGPTEFTYNVPHDIDTVVVNGSTNDPLANVNAFGQYAVDYGENDVKVRVRAQNGDTKEYVIKVTRAYNNNFASLSVNKGVLSPEFDAGRPDNFEYTVVLPIDVDRLHIEATAENAPIASVIGNGWIPLEIGTNPPKKITVTSPDGSSKSVYVKAIRSASINTNLATLDIDQGRLTPIFNKEVYEYDTYIRDTHTSINLTIIPEDASATFEIVGNDNATINNDRVTITNVVDDVTEITVRVTAESGESKDTVLRVHRQPPALFSNLLKSLEVTSPQGVVNIGVFNPNTNSYLAFVDEAITNVNVRATLQSAEAEIVIGTGNHILVPGRQVIEVVVRSKDGVENIYKITITRAKSGDATLQDLYFDEGNLTPIYTKGRKEYRMNVSGSTEYLTPHFTPSYSGTTVAFSGPGYDTPLQLGENTYVIKTTAPNGIGSDEYKVVVTRTSTTSVYLKELSASLGELSPSFNKLNEGPYRLELDSDMNSVLLSGIPEEPNSVESIEGLGLIDMSTTNNKTVVIVVKGKAGNTMRYTVEIVKRLNEDVKLSYLGVTPGTLEPTFDPEVSKYKVSVGSAVDRIEIFAGTLGQAEISGTGVKNLSVGTQEFTVTLTTESGSIGVYTIEVEREAVHSAKVLSLTFKEALIETPLFHKDEEQYSLSVPYEIHVLTIDTIVFEDPDNVEYDLIQTNFRIGINEVVLEVRNTLNGDVVTYTFEVTRHVFSSNFLMDLTTNRGLLTPEFDKHHNNYEIDIPYEFTEIALIGYKEDGTSSESGLGMHRDLVVGINTIPVVITSAQGVPRTYIVRVNRLPDDKNELIDLHVTGGTISPQFGENMFDEYTINVPEDINEITLTGIIPNTATVEGLDNLSVLNGTDHLEGIKVLSIRDPEALHTIVVKAQDGSTKSYKLTIKKELSSDSSVSMITPNEGTLSPLFNPDIDTYELVVPDEVNRVGFIVDKNNQFADVVGHTERNISYGDNTFTITITSEDGTQTNTYTINVVREKDISSLSITNDNVVLSVGESKQLDLVITPDDATNREVTWISDNPDAVSVDENGIITAIGVGSATITAYSTKNPNIKTEAVVEVLRLRIESDVLDIVRDALTESEIKDYVIGSEQMTSVRDYKDLFNNESSTLKLFDGEGQEIENYDKFVGTEMVLRLIVNGTVYDELLVVVRGDNNGDGIVDITDFAILQNITLGLTDLTELVLLINDLNLDKVIDVNDVVKFQGYLVGTISKLNGGDE